MTVTGPGLEVAHQVGVDHGELAGQVRFDEQVLVGGLDRLADTPTMLEMVAVGRWPWC